MPCVFCVILLLLLFFFLVRLFCLSGCLFVVFLLCIFCVVYLGDFLLVRYVFFVLGLELSFTTYCFPCLSFHLLIALDILRLLICPRLLPLSSNAA